MHITVGGADGAKLAPSSETLSHLKDAIAGAHDFTTVVDVQSYQDQFFNVQARLVLDSDYVAADVLSAAANAVKAAFSFDQREFGQGVHQSEVVGVLQGVPGVIATELDRLYLVTDPFGPSQTAAPEFLAAASATWDSAGAIHPAQLVTINPVGIALTETKP